MEMFPPTRHTAFNGNYCPRRCGIATFTTDLCEAIAARIPAASCIAGAMNGHQGGYDYPSRALSEIEQDDRGSYTSAARFLPINNVEVVSVQHQFTPTSAGPGASRKPGLG
jgi:hypothetical protein